MSNFNKRDYDTQYNQKNIVRFTLALNKKYDQDLIDFLNSLSNRSESIKSIIRNYISNANYINTDKEVIIDDLKKLVKKYDVK